MIYLYLNFPFWKVKLLLEKHRSEFTRNEFEGWEPEGLISGEMEIYLKLLMSSFYWQKYCHPWVYNFFIISNWNEYTKSDQTIVHFSFGFPVKLVKCNLHLSGSHPSKCTCWYKCLFECTGWKMEKAGFCLINIVVHQLLCNQIILSCYIFSPRTQKVNTFHSQSQTVLMPADYIADSCLLFSESFIPLHIYLN